MGFFGKLRERQKQRVEDAKREAEQRAQAAGASAQEVAEAAQQAADKEHRRNIRRAGGS